MDFPFYSDGSNIIYIVSIDFYIVINNINI